MEGGARSSIRITVEVLHLLGDSSSSRCPLELNSALWANSSRQVLHFLPSSLYDEGVIFIAQIRESVDDLLMK